MERSAIPGQTTRKLTQPGDCASTLHPRLFISGLKSAANVLDAPKEVHSSDFLAKWACFVNYTPKSPNCKKNVPPIFPSSRKRGNIGRHCAELSANCVSACGDCIPTYCSRFWILVSSFVKRSDSIGGVISVFPPNDNAKQPENIGKERARKTHACQYVCFVFFVSINRLLVTNYNRNGTITRGLRYASSPVHFSPNDSYPRFHSQNVIQFRNVAVVE